LIEKTGERRELNGGIGSVADSLSSGLSELLIGYRTIGENTGSDSFEEGTCCAETVDLHMLVYDVNCQGVEWGGYIDRATARRGNST
jgi:hypothetical protein